MSYKVKKVLKVIALVLVCCTACMTVMHLSGAELKSPTEWFEKDVNEKNLIKVDDNYIKTLNTNRGVDIEVSENGTIKLKGEATSDYQVQVATVELLAGTYTLSGIKNPDINKFYLYVTWGTGGSAIAGTDSATFELDGASTTVTIYLTWVDEYKFTPIVGTKVQPVLVEGAVAGSFYAD